MSVNLPKMITYLESYMNFGSTSSQEMMFKSLNVSFAPKCLVMVPQSRQFHKLILLHSIPYMQMTTTCLCIPNALDFVL